MIQTIVEHPLLKAIPYGRLNARQQENYNYQKLSAVLADYGFLTHRLTDDWNGADLIAQHIAGNAFVKIQLKGRLTLSKKYQGKDIWIAFRKESEWFLYPHDSVLEVALKVTNIANTKAWKESGGYSFTGTPETLAATLDSYKITHMP